MTRPLLSMQERLKRTARRRAEVEEDEMPDESEPEGKSDSDEREMSESESEPEDDVATLLPFFEEMALEHFPPSKTGDAPRQLEAVVAAARRNLAPGRDLAEELVVPVATILYWARAGRAEEWFERVQPREDSDLLLRLLASLKREYERDILTGQHFYRDAETSPDPVEDEEVRLRALAMYAYLFGPEDLEALVQTAIQGYGLEPREAQELLRLARTMSIRRDRPPSSDEGAAKSRAADAEHQEAAEAALERAEATVRESLGEEKEQQDPDTAFLEFVKGEWFPEQLQAPGAAELVASRLDALWDSADPETRSLANRLVEWSRARYGAQATDDLVLARMAHRPESKIAAEMPRPDQVDEALRVLRTHAKSGGGGDREAQRLHDATLAEKLLRQLRAGVRSPLVDDSRTQHAWAWLLRLVARDYLLPLAKDDAAGRAVISGLLEPRGAATRQFLDFMGTLLDTEQEQSAWRQLLGGGDDDDHQETWSPDEAWAELELQMQTVREGEQLLRPAEIESVSMPTGFITREQRLRADTDRAMDQAAIWAAQLVKWAADARRTLLVQDPAGTSSADASGYKNVQRHVHNILQLGVQALSAGKPPPKLTKPVSRDQAGETAQDSLYDAAARFAVLRMSQLTHKQQQAASKQVLVLRQTYGAFARAVSAEAQALQRARDLQDQAADVLAALVAAVSNALRLSRRQEPLPAGLRAVARDAARASQVASAAPAGVLRIPAQGPGAEPTSVPVRAKHDSQAVAAAKYQDALAATLLNLASTEKQDRPDVGAEHGQLGGVFWLGQRLPHLFDTSHFYGAYAGQLQAAAAAHAQAEDGDEWIYAYMPSRLAAPRVEAAATRRLEAAASVAHELGYAYAALGEMAETLVARLLDLRALYTEPLVFFAPAGSGLAAPRKASGPEPKDRAAQDDRWRLLAAKRPVLVGDEWPTHSAATQLARSRQRSAQAALALLDEAVARQKGPDEPALTPSAEDQLRRLDDLLAGLESRAPRAAGWEAVVVRAPAKAAKEPGFGAGVEAVLRAEHEGKAAHASKALAAAQRTVDELERRTKAEEQLDLKLAVAARTRQADGQAEASRILEQGARRRQEQAESAVEDLEAARLASDERQEQLAEFRAEERDVRAAWRLAETQLLRAWNPGTSATAAARQAILNRLLSSQVQRQPFASALLVPGSSPGTV